MNHTDRTESRLKNAARIFLVLVTAAFLPAAWTETSAADDAASGGKSGAVAIPVQTPAARFPAFVAEGQTGAAEIDGAARRVFVPLPYKGADGALFPLTEARPTAAFLQAFPEFTGRTLNLARGETIEFFNSDSETSETWTLSGGYQLSDSSFADWHSERVTGFISIGTRTCGEMAGADTDSVWDNGNPPFAATGSKKWPTRRIQLADGSVGAELITRKAFGVIASGNLFTGRVVRNYSLSQLLASTKGDGKELIQWGVPFQARPKGVRVKFKYEGLGDNCTISACLENRASGERRYVATAWYKSDRDDDTDVDGVISISEPDQNGLRTLEMDFFYGHEHEAADPLPPGAVLGNADEDITHVNVVFASSARGDWFEGVENARLLVKDFAFVY